MVLDIRTSKQRKPFSRRLWAILARRVEVACPHGGSGGVGGVGGSAGDFRQHDGPFFAAHGAASERGVEAIAGGQGGQGRALGRAGGRRLGFG